jgi:putative phosphoribosyl transferase
MLFRDRTDAGRRLAARLMSFRSRDPVVLALPRGGVPVGLEIARALGAPLDVVLVRKIGVPFQPELALGAIVDGDPPELVIDTHLKTLLDIPDAYVDEERQRQLAEIARRRRVYLAGRSPAAVAGRTVIVVDDGIATGSTMRAALRAIRRRGPAHLVLAVPVAPPETIAALRDEVDEVVCLETPTLFGAIGQFYADFRQLEDAEVIAALQVRASETAPTDGTPPRSRAPAP